MTDNLADILLVIVAGSALLLVAVALCCCAAIADRVDRALTAASRANDAPQADHAARLAQRRAALDEIGHTADVIWLDDHREPAKVIDFPGGAAA